MATEYYKPDTTYIRLPDELIKKRCLVNVKNDNNECLRWAVLSALHKLGKRVSDYEPYKNNLDFSGIEFPLSYGDFQTFAEMNDLIINVFMWRGGKTDVIYTDQRLYKEDLPVINLLWYENHYVWIKKPNAFFGNKHTCLRCLEHFTSEKKLHTHIDDDCIYRNFRMNMFIFMV